MGGLVQDVIDISRGKTPRKEKAARAAAEEAEFKRLNPEILMPDEEELRRQARRDLAGRASIGGRISTILTGRLGGPGGSTRSKPGGGSGGGGRRGGGGGGGGGGAGRILPD